MVEDITRQAAAFVQEASKPLKRAKTPPNASPEEKIALRLIEDLVDGCGVEFVYSGARARMPSKHPLRDGISITEPVRIIVDGFEAILRAGDISTHEPPSCPDRFFRLVAESISGRPNQVLTLANVDPYGRVTGRNRQRLNPEQLAGFTSTLRLMAQSLDPHAQQEAYHRFFNPSAMA